MNRRSILISLLLILALGLTGCGPKSADESCKYGVTDWAGCLTDEAEAEKWLEDNPDVIVAIEATETPTEAPAAIVIAANPEGWIYDENCVSTVSVAATNICVQSSRETTSWLNRMGYTSPTDTAPQSQQPIIIVVPYGQNDPQQANVHVDPAQSAAQPNASDTTTCAQTILALDPANGSQSAPAGSFVVVETVDNASKHITISAYHATSPVTAQIVGMTHVNVWYGYCSLEAALQGAKSQVAERESEASIANSWNYGYSVDFDPFGK